MKKIEINIEEMDWGFDEKTSSIFIKTNGIEDWITSELSWFSVEELLEGYKTEFVGSLSWEVYQGINEHILTYTTDARQYKIVNDRIYFDTYLEE